MMVRELTKKELNEMVGEYVKDRNYFCGLISFEDFLKDYVVRCEECKELFVTDNDTTICENCLEHIKQEKEENIESFNEHQWNEQFNNWRDYYEA